MPTPAIDSLVEGGVAHTLHEYEVDEAVGDGYGEAVARAIGVDPRSVFKTLLAEVDGDHLVAIVPVTSRLSLKKLAAASGGKRAAMADAADAERLTGYVSGGISPFGQRRSLAVFLDESARRLEKVYVSAGKRGLQVELRTRDLIDLTEARLATLTLSPTLSPLSGGRGPRRRRGRGL